MNGVVREVLGLGLWLIFVTIFIIIFFKMMYFKKLEEINTYYKVKQHSLFKMISIAIAISSLLLLTHYTPISMHEIGIKFIFHATIRIIFAILIFMKMFSKTIRF
jgi:hypothetical protein